MTEEDVLEATDSPVTVSTLTNDLRDLGVAAGDVVLVHSSMRSLGWVAGGAPAVVDALQSVVTAEGTLVMPTHSGDYSEPSYWEHPPVSEEWEPVIREEMPPYRPEVTPTRGVGAVPECFRNYPDVVRSAHPSVSFAAWGADAERVVADHTLDDRLGEESPLARLYDLGASVLHLGTGYDTSTSLHLAEYRVDYPTETEMDGAPVLRDGERVWATFESVVENTDDFAEVGAAFEAADDTEVVTGPVGAGTATLIDQRDLVDFAVQWFEEHRAG